jgi:hypothetical protein
MANLYWSGPKAPEKETRKALMKELVECTDDAFDIRFGGDGAGKHVAVYVEACPPTYVKEILNWVRGD